ncbi:cytochrome o ubiquinol oxidase subunit IV [Buchnera aphidicola (Kurisakia onigurumii)]|uniref:cytochrome o ubiquinol oxidase subunit IV n=1 Tax=Buchnera aphidicola TaxID=9 RepID=UPI0031B6D4C5
MFNFIKKNLFFSKKSNLYFLGLLYSLILTCLSFFITFYTIFSNKKTYIILILFLTIQFMVHILYFLHIKKIKNLKWNLIISIFSLLIIVIIIFGSIWIMYNLHSNLLQS